MALITIHSERHSSQLALKSSQRGAFLILATLHLGYLQMALVPSSAVPRLHGQSFYSIITSLLKSAFSSGTLFQLEWSLDQRNPAISIHFYGPYSRNFCSLRLVFLLSMWSPRTSSSYMHIWLLSLAIYRPSQWWCTWRATTQSLHATCVQSKESAFHPCEWQCTMFLCVMMASQTHRSNTTHVRFHYEITHHSWSKQWKSSMPQPMWIMKALQPSMALSSLSFPVSFPYNFMHLIWTNLIPNLICFWTGKFKDISHHNEGYWRCARSLHC